MKEQWEIKRKNRDSELCHLGGCAMIVSYLVLTDLRITDFTSWHAILLLRKIYPTTYRRNLWSNKRRWSAPVYENFSSYRARPQWNSLLVFLSFCLCLLAQYSPLYATRLMIITPNASHHHHQPPSPGPLTPLLLPLSLSQHQEHISCLVNRNTLSLGEEVF